MGTVLQIAGVVFLGIVLLILIAILIVKRKWRKFKNTLGDLAREESTPSRIHLNEDLSPDWLNKDEVKPMLAKLVKSGFKMGRAYSIKEMDGVGVLGLFHGKTGVCCALYEHPQIGNWVDLVVQYSDGEELTISNAPQGSEIDHRPEVTKVFMSGADLSELVAEYKKKSQKKPRVKLTDGNFREIFEESYAKDMDWRARRGGTTMEEVERVAANMEDDFPETVVHDTHRDMQIRLLERWHDECLEALRRNTNMSAAQWTQYEERGEFFIIPDSGDTGAYVDYLMNYMDFTDRQYEQFSRLAEKTDSVKKLFGAINKTLSPDLKAKKVGDVDQPVPAIVCLAPFGD